MKEITKYLSEGTPFPCRDMNPEPLTYEAGMLLLWSQRVVWQDNVRRILRIVRIKRA